MVIKHLIFAKFSSFYVKLREVFISSIPYIGKIEVQESSITCSKSRGWKVRFETWWPDSDMIPGPHVLGHAK